MSKKEISDKCTEFNNILTILINQVGDHISFGYRFMLENYMKISKTGPIETFLVHVLPVRDKILARDESYFNNDENYKKSLDADEAMMEEFFRLQNIYESLDVESKKNLWDIMQALLVLGEEYIILNKDKYLAK